MSIDGKHYTITGSETLAKGRFVTLERLHYHRDNEPECLWEAAQRTSSRGAAVVIATLKPSGRVLMIRQYRPPLHAFALEFPAGLIDDGEDAAESALRELKEETGFIGTVDIVLPQAASSGGMTGELLTSVFVSIDETLADNLHPVQNLQDNEEIEVYAVELSQVRPFIDECIAQGDVPDSRLMIWAAMVCLDLNP